MEQGGFGIIQVNVWMVVSSLRAQVDLGER